MEYILMDIMTHTLSGVALSTMVAAIAKRRLRETGLLIFCGGLGGAFADIDAISLWSGFDATIGKFLDLAHTGRDIYFSNYFYSHHNFTHSFVGAVAFSLLSGLCFLLAAFMCSEGVGRTSLIKFSPLCGLSFFCGYVMHLLGDLPTPSCVWHGIKLFWPLPASIGGTGHLWWWNNYDIFLLVLFCCAANIGLIILYRFVQKPFIPYLPVIIFISVSALVFYQIVQRPAHFAYEGYTPYHVQYERQSLEIQKQILGQPLYGMMVNLDRKLKINF